MNSPTQGATVGVFGTDRDTRTALESAVAKKSEAEGIVVYHRTDGGRRISLLDTEDYPERIQGYARVASISDHAFYIFPKNGKLSAPDGELAVLLEAFGLSGTLQLLDGTSTSETVRSALRGTAVAGYDIDERSSASSVLDLSRIGPRADFRNAGAMIYVDKAFSVKGVGTVALGFILSGTVSVHDRLRPVPGPLGLTVDVKGIQINDVDFDSAGRGIRVGLSLRGVEAKDLERSHWLDDGSFQLADRVRIQFKRSGYYKQELDGRDLHVQLPGEMLPAGLAQAPDGILTASLPVQAPVWGGMRAAVVDLNAKALRIAGGGACIL